MDQLPIMKLMKKFLWEAIKSSRKGNVVLMDYRLYAAHTTANKIGRDITTRTKKIRKVGYENTIERELKEAKKYAKSARRTIEGIKSLSEELCTRNYITIREIARLAPYAMNASIYRTRFYYNQARTYGIKLQNLDIEDRIAEIERILEN